MDSKCGAGSRFRRQRAGSPAATARPRRARKGRVLSSQAFSSGKLRESLLCSLDEIHHEGERRFRMRLKQEMPTVQDVPFHAWEVLHPGERFGDVEEGVVAAPEHQ